MENIEIKEEIQKEILPSSTVKDIFNLDKQKESVKIEIKNTQGRT